MFKDMEDRITARTDAMKAELIALSTAISDMNARMTALYDAHNNAVTPPPSTDAQIYLDTLREEKEVLKLRIELYKLEHSGNVTPIQAPTPRIDGTLKQQEAAMKWVNNHWPMKIQLFHGAVNVHETVEEYYCRYEVEHEPALPPKTFEMLAREVLNIVPSYTHRHMRDGIFNVVRVWNTD